MGAWHSQPWQMPSCFARPLPPHYGHVIGQKGGQLVDVEAKELQRHAALMKDRRAELYFGRRTVDGRIHKLVLEVGVDLDRVLAYFGVQALHDIAATDFQRVIRSLEKRRAAAA